MTVAAVDLLDSKHILRTSDRIAWKRCRRQHQFGSIWHRNLVPLRGSKPLEFGTDWHTAMGALYDPDTWHLVKNPKTRGPILESVRQIFTQTQIERKREYADENGGYSLEVDDDFAERLILGLGMLNGYFSWHIEVDNFKPVRVEVDFEVPILTDEGEEFHCQCHGWPVVYQGRLDGIVQDQFGWYWILEHKTAAQMGPTEHLALDEQTGSYAWAVKQMLGLRVQGVIYSEAVKKVAHPPLELLRPREGRNFSINKNQDTTYELALHTLSKAGEKVELYQDFLEYLKLQGNKFFRRTQVHRNLYELEDQGRRIYYEAREMLDPNTVPYPNPSRFTCQMCAFRPPCLAMNDGSDYEYLLQEGYRERTKEEVDARRAR